MSLFTTYSASAVPTLLSLLALTASSTAHSWVEQMQEISSTGAYTGAMGYPRGYVSRVESTFNGNSMDYLLPPLVSGRTRVNASDLLCHPAQRTANQTSGFPMLSISPGSFLAMKYLENGHVTLPLNQLGKPPGAGSVYVFATTSPSPTELLTDVLRWTPSGTGGDGRGRLLTAQNFDDMRCHQLNSGAISTQRQAQFPDRVPGQPTSNVEQWCETDLGIPPDAAEGVLTLYWVWQWPTAPGVDPGLPTGKDEYYTTCADVLILPPPSSSGNTSAVANVEVDDKFALVQQDPQTLAVKDFASRTAFVTNPLSTGGGNGTAAAATGAAGQQGKNIVTMTMTVTEPPVMVTVTATTVETVLVRETQRVATATTTVTAGGLGRRWKG